MLHISLLCLGMRDSKATTNPANLPVILFSKQVKEEKWENITTHTQNQINIVKNFCHNNNNNNNGEHRQHQESVRSVLLSRKEKLIFPIALLLFSLSLLPLSLWIIIVITGRGIYYATNPGGDRSAGVVVHGSVLESCIVSAVAVIFWLCVVLICHFFV